MRGDAPTPEIYLLHIALREISPARVLTTSNQKPLLRSSAYASANKYSGPSKRGAHLLLQTRVKILNRELGSGFQRWYPDMQVEEVAEVVCI